MTILKRIFGALKMGILYSPLVLGPLGFVTSIGGLIADGVVTDNHRKNMRKSIVVQQMINEEKGVYHERLEKGELTLSEYSEKLEYVQSNDYIDNITDLPQFSEERTILKNKLEVCKSCSVGGVVTVVGSLGLIALYTTNVGDIIYESALNDFNYVSPKKAKKKDDDFIEIKY